MDLNIELHVLNCSWKNIVKNVKISSFYISKKMTQSDWKWRRFPYKKGVFVLGNACSDVHSLPDVKKKSFAFWKSTSFMNSVNQGWVICLIWQNLLVVYPDIDADSLNSVIILQFLQGLNNVNLRSRLRNFY